MKTARQLLEQIAAKIEEDALEAQFEAIAQFRRAAKLEQLAACMTDDQTKQCLANLTKEGLIELGSDGIGRFRPQSRGYYGRYTVESFSWARLRLLSNPQSK